MCVVCDVLVNVFMNMGLNDNISRQSARFVLRVEIARWVRVVCLCSGFIQ